MESDTETGAQRGWGVFITGDIQNSSEQSYEQPALIWPCFEQGIEPGDLQRSCQPKLLQTYSGKLICIN